MLNADDDYIERWRKHLYPILHRYLPKGLYATANVRWNQYVGTVHESEDTIEAELVDLGFIRNPVSAYKTLPDGRESEGSWVLWNEHRSDDYVDFGMQLHITMFETQDGDKGRELYAHYEDDWRYAPVSHLREKNFDPHTGVGLARDLLDAESYLVVEERRKYADKHK